MVLTLFISEDKRDEFAGTAWPFDSLLEHTNQGALAQKYVGLSPETYPSQPTPGAPAPLPPVPGQEGDRFREGPAPVASGSEGAVPGASRRGAGLGGPTSPHLDSCTVRSKLRSWEASWGTGAPVFSPGSCFTEAAGNLAGVACCPFPTGEEREDGVREAEGFIRAHTRSPRWEGAGWVGWGPGGALASGQQFSPLT